MRTPDRKTGRIIVRWCLLAAAMTLLAGTVVAHARVFQRWGAVSDSTRAITASGGKLLYRTDVTINNGRGTLEVFSYPASIDETMRQLGAAFNMDVSGASGSMAFAAAKTDGRALGFTALFLGEMDRTIVFKLDRKESEADKSRGILSTHTAGGIAAFPGSAPLFSAANDDTEAALSVFQTSAAVPEIIGFYHSSLSSSGWTHLLDGMPDNSSSAMAIFMRNDEIACVHAMDGAGIGGGRIALLHKRLSNR